MILFLHAFINSPMHFVMDCLGKQNSLFNSFQTSWNLYFVLMLGSLKLFFLLMLLLVFIATDMSQTAPYGIFQNVQFCSLYSSKNLVINT